MAFLHSRKLIVLSLVVMILLASASLLYLFKKDYIMEAWSAYTLPPELKKATFISMQENTTTLLSVSGARFKKEVLKGVLISADEREQNTAQIILDENGVYNIFLNRKNIYATSSPLAGVSVSPDGTMVAYAHGTTPLMPLEVPQLIPNSSFDSRAWSVTVLSLASGALLEVGAGAAPLFIDSTNLLHFAPGGVFITDVRAQKKNFVLPGVFINATVSTLQSPDRTLVGWKDSFSNTVTIYRVSVNGLEKVADMTNTGAGSHTLGNDALYRTYRSIYGGGIMKQGFGETEAYKVGFLPSLYPITRLSLGSI